jgi:TolB-like protein/class 3 adenylate cyclase
MTQEGFKRKLAAILSADVESYSRLMRDDEEATIRRLTTYRSAMTTIIQQYRGRVVDAPGDNMLAEFTSVVDAVNCGVEIQREMTERNAKLPEERRMKLRIGINLGDVVEEGKRIYGDGVNIAARMERLAEAGGICISATVYDSIVNKLGLEYEYLGEQTVKNIPEPIRTYRVLSLPGAAAHRVIKAKETLERKWRKAAMAIAALVFVGAAIVAWYFYFQPSRPQVEVASAEKMAFPLPDKPSIAVLPFVNMSEDAKQEYFSDGITEDLITDLSKISGLFVIARNSVFTYKSKPVQIRQVAEDLGVRYVLEGSVRRMGNQVRINAQLIDATTGGHLWAERYDDKMENVFALQDRITQKIVSALKVKLTAGEEKQIVHRETNSTEAYEAFLKGYAHYRFKTPDDFDQAIPYLEEAINKDPNYGRAYAALADVYWEIAKTSWKSWMDSHDLSRAEILVKAENYLQRAMKDPTPLAHFVASDMRRGQGRHQDSITEATRAIALDAGDPAGYLAMAKALIWAGSPVEGADFIHKAMRLDPNYPPEYLHWLGIAQFGMERFEEAATTLEEAIRRSTYTETPLWLAATYGHLGRVEEAKQAIQTFREREAKTGWFFDIRTLEFVDIWWFKEQADIDRLRKGLSIAGVPAGSAYSIEEKDLVSQTNEGPEVKGATAIDVTTAKALFDRGIPFVDVRNMRHWSKGHIPGAVHLWGFHIFSEYELSKIVSIDQEVVIYCAGYT